MTTSYSPPPNPNPNPTTAPGFNILVCVVTLVLASVVALALSLVLYPSALVLSSGWWRSDRLERETYDDEVRGDIAPAVLNREGRELVRSSIRARQGHDRACVQAGLKMPEFFRNAHGTPANVCGVPLTHHRVNNDCTPHNPSFDFPDAIERMAIDHRHDDCRITFREDVSEHAARKMAIKTFVEDDGVRFRVHAGFMGTATAPSDSVWKSAPIASGLSTNFRNLTMATEGAVRTTGGGVLSGTGGMGAIRAVSVQWYGFFRAPTTGRYVFRLRCNGSGYVWLGELARDGRYRASNAVIDLGANGAHGANAGDDTVNERASRRRRLRRPRTRQVRVELRANTRYPLRIQYGTPVQTDFNNNNVMTFGFEIPSSSSSSSSSLHGVERNDGLGMMYPTAGYEG